MLLDWKKRAFLGMLLLIGTILIFGGRERVYAAEDSSAPYQVMVNRAANCVTVYEKDEQGEYTKPLRSFVCSTGREVDSTPLGVFKTSDYYNWRLMVDGSYGQYAIRFYKSILFHSVPYYSQRYDDLESEQFNLLGNAASLGCVRLAASDVKWLYDNCPVGTPVIVYDNAENPGPLGKPMQQVVPADHPYRNWDPTDPNPANPWHTLKPSLYLKQDMGDGVIYVPVGASQEYFKNVIGVQYINGVHLPDDWYQLDVNGNYDLNTFGTYRVWVTGFDQLGVSVQKEMVLAVVYM